MYAKAAEPALQEDKRADRGFTATTGTQTKSRPVIGDIVITAYNNKHWLSSPCALCSRSQMAPAPWHLRCLQDGVCATGASATLARKFWVRGLAPLVPPRISLRAASGGVLPANRVATLAVSWTMPHVSSLAQAEIFWTIIRWMDMLPRRIASNLVQAVAF